MPAGSISLTNGSASVTGDGTSFTTEAESGEYLLCTDGGVNYTLPVTSVTSDTELTLSADFTGPTASGLSYRVISGAQLVSVPTDLINQTTLAIRELNTDKGNWNQLLTVDGDVTIIAPDGTKISGPSWVKVSKGINATDLDKAQQIADQTSAAATAAATSETNAKASEHAAAQSASDASSSATNAADSAQQAADSASSIGDELDQASASAAAAAKSATDAAASEANASTSETNAKNSEDAAAASQQAASDSKDAAATSETNAATSETNAADSASAAATSEQNAAQSASDSSDSASAAATSETNAASSASDSADSATSAGKSADRAEDAASALENNNALAEAIDHIDTDTNDVFFKGSIASGGTTAFTELRTVSDGVTSATSEIVLTDSTLVTDDDPDATVVKTWTLPDDEGQLITLDDTGIATATDSTVAFKGSVSVGVDASRDTELVTLRQLNSAVAGGGGSNGATLNGVMNNFIGAVMWMNGTRASLPAGYLAADGQMLKRDDYPDLWAAVSAGLFVSTEETNWTGSAGARGYYSDGDGSSTFRLPDLNGRQSGSIQGVFLRGDEDGMLPGEIRSSALPNITAQFGSAFDGQVWLGWNSVAGSASAVITVDNVMHPLSGYEAHTGLSQINIDASRSSGIYENGINEVRPPSASGMWIIRVSGTFNAADTNFNVINGDDTFPDPGVNAYGGDLRSVYQVGGNDYLSVGLRARVLSGTGIFSEIRMVNPTGDTVNTTTWTLPGSEGTLFGSGQPLSFNNASDAHQSLQNMGINSDGTLVILPFSSTQGFMIISRTVVQTQNTSGDSTVTFPRAFSAISNVVISNGDGNVAMANYAIVNAIRTSGFDVRVFNGTSPLTGVCRVNYIAAGTVNL